MLSFRKYNILNYIDIVTVLEELSLMDTNLGSRVLLGCWGGAELRHCHSGCRLLCLHSLCLILLLAASTPQFNHLDPEARAGSRKPLQ